jgi:glyoxylase-like metal-dependent hydrolase (beta-lactamase superfamily II)
VNAYLVDTGETTLVDAGMPNTVDDLRGELDEAGYDAEDIDRVLITHFDLDRVGTLAHLAFDDPIYAVEPDASFLDGSRTPPLSNHKGVLQRLTDFWLTRPSTPVQRLNDGDSVAEFDAHHAPSHTPGHTVYLHSALHVYKRVR